MSALVGLLAAAVLGAAPGAARLMDWPDLLGRPAPAAGRRIAYGPGPLQFGELWLPDGPGPFPVVLMVHGGCWRSGVAKLTIMNYAADDLRRRGYAVWNIEYRGVDRPGGGYPGTFEDVARAADALRVLAADHNLRLDHVVSVGHSAGGHLALWLAARARLSAGSPLRVPDPLPIGAVISLGGLPDLEAEHARGDDGCGAATVEALTGAPGAAHPDIYADTSPARLGRGADAETIVNGAEDPIAPAADGEAYAAKMRARGAHIRQITVAATGHVELIAPGTRAWTVAVKALERALPP